jgi:hypothetical protein
MQAGASDVATPGLTLKGWKTLSVGKNVQHLELSHTDGKNINWHKNSGKIFGTVY